MKPTNHMKRYLSKIGFSERSDGSYSNWRGTIITCCDSNGLAIAKARINSPFGVQNRQFTLDELKSYCDTGNFI